MAYDSAMGSLRFPILLGTVAALAACKFGSNSAGATASSTRSGTGSAVLSWTAPSRNTDGSLVGKIAGYYVYYGLSPTTILETIQVSDPSATSYRVQHLDPGTYYFSVAAYNSAGARGLRSTPISKTIEK
jgi:hypothetical protein